MEPTQIQLAFNVVAITGVSSLATFCYLLKKDNRKLAAGLKVETRPQESRTVSARRTTPTAPQDIRRFAANRRAEWVASAMSHDG